MNRFDGDLCDRKTCLRLKCRRKKCKNGFTKESIKDIMRIENMFKSVEIYDPYKRKFLTKGEV